jgi:hypothetical protein
MVKHTVVKSLPFSKYATRKQTIDSDLYNNIRIWKCIRAPFLYPHRLETHSCSQHWERIAVDTAGCRVCGNIHICHHKDTKILCSMPDVDLSICEVSSQEDGLICTVTGLCIHNSRFSEHERLLECDGKPPPVAAASSDTNDCVAACKPPSLLSPPSPHMPSSNLSASSAVRVKVNNFKTGNKSFKDNNKYTRANMSNTHQRRGAPPHRSQSQPHASKTHHQVVEGCYIIEFEAVLATCRSILCSPAYYRCQQKEHSKLNSRVRWSMMKHIRNTKSSLVPGTPVNAMHIISAVAHDLRNYRIFPVESDSLSCTLSQCREHVAFHAATIITRFINNAYASINNFMYNVSPHVFVVGVLYLLRVGLVAQHIVLLPQERTLFYLLPCENLLEQFFDIKCKCITEVENIVKLHTRMLSKEQLTRIQDIY